MEQWTIDYGAPVSEDLRTTPERRADRNRNIRIGAFWLCLGIGVATAAGLAVVGLRDGVNRKERILTVCDKEPVTRFGDPDGRQWLVFTADSSGESHTLEIKDRLVIGGTSFDTADEYGALREGVTYAIVTSGVRVEYTSQFPSIIEANPVPAEEQINYCER